MPLIVTLSRGLSPDGVGGGTGQIGARAVVTAAKEHVGTLGVLTTAGAGGVFLEGKTGEHQLVEKDTLLVLIQLSMASQMEALSSTLNEEIHPEMCFK